MKKYFSVLQENVTVRKENGSEIETYLKNKETNKTA